MELNNFPDIFQSKLRLMMISALVTGKKTFRELKEITGATDGNISVQITKLESVGFITVTKDFHKKRPQTTIAITKKGTHELLAYIDMLNRIVEQVQNDPFPPQS